MRKLVMAAIELRIAQEKRNLYAVNTIFSRTSVGISHCQPFDSKVKKKN